jgi:hypothetical protein
MDIADTFSSWRKTYKAGIDTMDSATARIIVVAERLTGRERVEKTYRSNGNTDPAETT